MSSLHFGRQCYSCGSTNIRRGRIRIQNGTFQVRDTCQTCGGNANGKGINVPHKFIPDLESIPIAEDYCEKYSEPCAVCGTRDGTELHHFAPKKYFPDEYENWPKAYLCKKHHRDWHVTMEKGRG